MTRILLCGVLLAASLAAGCASYTRAKIDLTDQVRRGLSSTRAASADRRKLIDAYVRQQRVRLDDAFDADVARRPSLLPAWVIEHRKAYAIGVDALHAQQRALEQAERNDAASLDALDSALRQLQRMHHAELQLTLPEVSR